MTFFPWEDRYRIGVDKIDLQHEKLVGLLNDLYNAMHAGEGRAALSRVLTGLTRYVETHFQTEEQIMRDRGYPDLALHRRKHEKMTQKVGDLQSAFESGKIISPVQISNFLKGWLQKHILETDRQFGDFCRMRDRKSE